ncbi:hypothetical protein GUITHDRAFT_152532, partial [Guillardia theta CCMP2712]
MGSDATIEGMQVGKGGSVEVEAEGEWWDAEVIKIKNGQIKIHYVGGLSQDDEWIPIASSRVRLPRSTEAAKEGLPKKRGRSSQQESAEPVPVPHKLPFKLHTMKTHDKAKKKQSRGLKKIIESEGFDKMSLEVATYSSIEAPPSILPSKKYCDLTGLGARYTDPQTKL